MARDVAGWAIFPLLVVALGTFAVVASTWDPATPLGLPADANPGLLILVGLATDIDGVDLVANARDPFGPELRALPII